MSSKLFPILFLSLFQIATLTAQPPTGMNRNSNTRPSFNGNFYGRVLEATTGKAIEFASIQLLQSKFDSLTKKRKDVIVSGMLTNAKGEFRLENIPVFGQYKLKIDVIGYKSIEKVIGFDVKMPSGNNPDMGSLLS
ncbi:MAG: hypothetical protein RLZ11_680, partial [Bacteroidota bacterium]